MGFVLVPLMTAFTGLCSSCFSTSSRPSPTSLPSGSHMTPMRPAVPVGSWRISSRLGLLFLLLDFPLFWLACLWWVLFSIVLLGSRGSFRRPASETSSSLPLLRLSVKPDVAWVYLSYLRFISVLIEFSKCFLSLTTFSQIMWFLAFSTLSHSFQSFLDSCLLYRRAIHRDGRNTAKTIRKWRSYQIKTRNVFSVLWDILRNL